jgi:hypothetical protein
MNWPSHIVPKPCTDIPKFDTAHQHAADKIFSCYTAHFTSCWKSTNKISKTARNAAGNHVLCINFVHRTTQRNLAVLLNITGTSCSDWHRTAPRTMQQNEPSRFASQQLADNYWSLADRRIAAWPCLAVSCCGTLSLTDLSHIYGETSWA